MCVSVQEREKELTTEDCKNTRRLDNMSVCKKNNFFFRKRDHVVVCVTYLSTGGNYITTWPLFIRLSGQYVSSTFVVCLWKSFSSSF